MINVKKIIYHLVWNVYKELIWVQKSVRSVKKDVLNVKHKQNASFVMKVIKLIIIICVLKNVLIQIVLNVVNNLINIKHAFRDITSQIIKHVYLQFNAVIKIIAFIVLKDII